MTPSLQEYIQNKVVPARLNKMGGVREVAENAVRMVMLKDTPEEAKAFFNFLIDEKAKKGGA